MKFKVKSGCHREGGKVYHSGDIVDSNRDLEKAFKNKFERVVRTIIVDEEESEKPSRRTKPPKSPEVVKEGLETPS